MTPIRTFGRLPTLKEMKEYYAREDVLDFLYDECQLRNVDIAFRRKRLSINPTSKSHLQEIINREIEDKIERAYKNASESLDDIRLEKFDYLSFHSRTSITVGRKLTGFDMIFEADMQGWRRSFEDLYGVIKLLDDFEVCYRMKYSGVRSLHLMIPFETLPNQFNGESILNQREDIYTKIQEYFRRRCGMKKAHVGRVLRLAYSLNEDNGLVSLPILSSQLSSFRPWEANIYNVTVDKPWHGGIPSSASRKTLKFLREVYNDDAKAKQGESRKISYALEIVPKESSNYAAESGSSSVEKWAAQLKSDEEVARVEAAWHLMAMPEAVPISILQEGLDDENPDVRWFSTEALQKRLDDDAISLASKMLWDEDQFVRISAIDIFAQAGENALNALSDSVNSVTSDINASSIELFSDIIYAINKICKEDKSKVAKSLVESIGSASARFLLTAIDNGGQFWRVRRYIRQLREETAIFPEVIKSLIPKLLCDCSEGKAKQHHISALLEVRKNEAVPLMTIREIANSLKIEGVKVPSNRMTEEEREFLTSAVKSVLTDMPLEGKARILAVFLLYCKGRLLEPSAKALLKIGIPEAVEALARVFAQQSIGVHRFTTVVNILKQIEPSIEKWLSERIDDANIQGYVNVNAFVQDKNVDELIEMLSNQNDALRIAAARALGEKCESKVEIDKIIVALGDKNEKTRTAALLALGEMKHGNQVLEAIRNFALHRLLLDRENLEG